MSGEDKRFRPPLWLLAKLLAGLITGIQTIAFSHKNGIQYERTHNKFKYFLKDVYSVHFGSKHPFITTN